MSLEYTGLFNNECFHGWTGVNTPGELELQSGLWVTKAGVRNFRNGFKYNPGKGIHWEWGAVMDGEFEFRYRDKTYKVTKGYSYIMASDVSLTAKSLGNPLLAWVEISGPIAARAMQKCGGKSGEVIIKKYSYEQIKCVIRIAKFLHGHPCGYELSVHSNLWDFLGNTIYTCDNKKRGVSSEIRNTIEYLEKQNFSGKYTLDYLSEISGLSKETFRKRFLKEVGEAPVKYVLKCKLRRAKELLSSKELTVRQVSVETGFDNQYYFSRVFKKYEGMWPIEYRKWFYQ